jgi:hypothetical protein
MCLVPILCIVFWCQREQLSTAFQKVILFRCPIKVFSYVSVHRSWVTHYHQWITFLDSNQSMGWKESHVQWWRPMVKYTLDYTSYCPSWGPTTYYVKFECLKVGPNQANTSRVCTSLIACSQYDISMGDIICVCTLFDSAAVHHQYHKWYLCT